MKRTTAYTPSKLRPLGSARVITVKPIARPGTPSSELLDALEHAVTHLQRWDECAPAKVKTDAGLASAFIDRRISCLIDSGTQVPTWPPIERMLERPCGRAATMELQEALHRSPPSPAILLACAQRLQGKTSLRWRCGPQFIRSRMSDLERRFCDASEVETNLCQMSANARLIAHPLERAIYLLANILSIHPLSDGNGRLARSAFSAVLIADGVLTDPLPLGTLLYRNAYPFVAALHEAQGRNDPLPLALFFVRLASTLGEIADNLENSDAPTESK